jgi:hypothetical protein
MASSAVASSASRGAEASNYTRIVAREFIERAVAFKRELR